MSSADDIAMREFSMSTTHAAKSSKGKWIAISIIVALVLAGAVVGILFGLKVIGSSSSSNDAASAGNGDLGSTNPSSSSTADAIGGSNSSSSTGVDLSSTGSTDSSTGGSGTITSSTGSTSTATSSTASTSSTAASSTASTSSTASSGSSTGAYVPPQPSKLTYSTYYNPFTADSPWNSRPLNPVFDTYVIPPDSYFPVVANGAYSTQIFYARSTDKPKTVYPKPQSQITIPDIGGGVDSIDIPHWPSGTEGASGTDGHADIYDETTGVVHSFWQLVHENTGVWTAALYSWCYINGTGWGNPAQFYQGPRATGVPSGAGIIRNHEVNDGLPYFRHALTMSMTFSGLSRDPVYVFPATSADNSASVNNYGKIPEGALMMLPPSFNVSQLTSLPLRKVAETLKRHGAYVTDRNDGTPFAFFVENGGPGFPLSNVSGWDGQVANELQLLRLGMRRVIGATQWVDGYDQPRAPLSPGRPNLLSMRGPWVKQWGPGTGYFDTWKQALVFPYGNTTRTQLVATNGQGLKPLLYVGQTPGQTYNFTVHSIGDALIAMQIFVAGKGVGGSPMLGDGGTWQVTWPEGGYAFFIAQSGINVSSQVWAEFIPVQAVAYDMSLGKAGLPAQPSPAAATPFPDPAGLPKLNFGTFQTPFAVDSPWNSRPLNPVLEAPLIPIDRYYPAVANGAYSTQMFHATASDPPQTVYPGPRGLSNPDIGGYSSSMVIPHWPAATEGASGTDGHADIYDETSGIIHSFWQLVYDNTTVRWTAALYSWCRIDGTGWGDPAHYYQGPRATGISSGAGILRNHELNDGLPFFRHALTMSLTFSGLSGSDESGGPGYVFPATSSDGDLSHCYGHIPEGSLLMLPPSFNVSALSGWPLRKVAETLKRYGAYVTDRNDGTPFVLYVENGGPGFKLSNTSGWDNQVAADLQTIRASLSRVLSATQWVDGNGNARAPLSPGTPNLLSMRGPWQKQYGPGTADFDTLKQAIVFPFVNTSSTAMAATNGRGVVGISWAQIRVNTSMIYTVHATGGALLELQLIVNGHAVAVSTALGDGKSWSFTWPQGAYIVLIAHGGIGQPSSAWGEVKFTAPQPFSFATGSYYPYP